MREIDVSLIRDTVEGLVVKANTCLPEDIRRAIDDSLEKEKWEQASAILKDIKRNYLTAENENIPICQDTGMAVIFMELGQDIHLINGDLRDFVNEGVRRGYRKGYLRKSVVEDPVRRGNTGDNTPAVLYTDIVPGDSIKITVAPKGFGSENMSRIKMLKPSDGIEGIKDFILETVNLSGPNPCPPMVIGVGIGGTFELCAQLSKRALMRDISVRNPDPYYASLEEEMLEKINSLGIGPQGFGGRTTALGVNILTYPTHIAGMPVAVNISCHVTRHITEVI